MAADNDTFEGRIRLTQPTGLLAFDLSNAVQGTDVAGGGVGRGYSLWFAYTAYDDGWLSVDTQLTSVDVPTVITVHQRTNASAPESLDNTWRLQNYLFGEPDRQPRALTNIQRGVTYYIEVDLDWSSDTPGRGTLRWIAGTESEPGATFQDPDFVVSTDLYEARNGYSVQATTINHATSYADSALVNDVNTLTSLQSAPYYAVYNAFFGGDYPGSGLQFGAFGGAGTIAASETRRANVVYLQATYDPPSDIFNTVNVVYPAGSQPSWRKVVLRGQHYSYLTSAGGTVHTNGPGSTVYVRGATAFPGQMEQLDDLLPTLTAVRSETGWNPYALGEPPFLELTITPDMVSSGSYMLFVYALTKAITEPSVGVRGGTSNNFYTAYLANMSTAVTFRPPLYSYTYIEPFPFISGRFNGVDVNFVQVRR